MDDLQVPMLTDIRRAIQQVQEREVGGFDEKALQQAVQEAISAKSLTLAVHEGKDLCATYSSRRFPIQVQRRRLVGVMWPGG